MIELREDRIPIYRKLYLTGTFLLCLFGMLFFAIKNHILWDEIFCLGVMLILFFGCFLFCLMRKRKTAGLTYNGTDYRRLFLMVLLCWGLVIGFSYVPSFFAPMILIPFFLYSVLEGTLAISMGIYFACVMCITCDYGIYIYFSYILLIIFGSLIADAMKQSFGRYALVFGVLAACGYVLLTLVFYYLAFLSMPMSTAPMVGIVALVVLLFVAIVYRWMLQIDHREEALVYENLMDDEYPLLQDIRRFSYKEYEHARKVSNLAGVCAREIGADPKVAMAGGLYYRLGKVIGEPEVKNGVKAAYNHCLPPAVITILAEFGALERFPSTKESAIVHMVDSLVTKIEVLGESTMASAWNQDMVIYQTLNEFSNNGVYDNSGISINQFLKIRERLVREGDLL
ncbi:MAG: hypothetical protein K6G04_01310 [Lachnospiraceae bacterium]|nr:hypothetical protein [Lachnospiraceae bacterium]